MSFHDLKEKHGLSVIAVISFVLLWEVGSRSKVLPVDFIGTPSKILVEFGHLWTPSIISTYLLPSVVALLLGLVSAIILGVVLGFLIGLNPVAKKVFRPFIFALNTIPFMVFFPLLILSFGISLQSVVIAITATCFAPILINVVEGVGNTDVLLLTMARSFSASNFFIFREVFFYSTLPYIVAGIKSAVGKAMVSLIIAELYGLNKGIGYLISFYGASFHADKLMSVVLFILLINCILFSIIWFIERNLHEEKRVTNLG